MQQYLALMRKPGGISDEMRGKLQAAQADIDREADAVQRSAQALQQARVVVERSRSELARLETNERAAIENRRQYIESIILHGTCDIPPIAPESETIARRRAEESFELEARRQALASLERRHSDIRNRKLTAEQRLASLEQEAQCGHANELAEEVEGLLRRLNEVVPVLVAGRSHGVSTERSDAILSTELLLPLVQALVKAPASMGGVVSDVNASVAGDMRGRRVGNAYWDRFSATLREAARPSTEEISQERVA
jgi:hypothetical protein